MIHRVRIRKVNAMVYKDVPWRWFCACCSSTTYRKYEYWATCALALAAADDHIYEWHRRGQR